MHFPPPPLLTFTHKVFSMKAMIFATSLLLGGNKPGSSIPDEFWGKLPCLFCKWETASKGLGERDIFVLFLLKDGDSGCSKAGSEREGCGWREAHIDRKTNYRSQGTTYTVQAGGGDSCGFMKHRFFFCCSYVFGGKCLCHFWQPQTLPYAERVWRLTYMLPNLLVYHSWVISILTLGEYK